MHGDSVENPAPASEEEGNDDGAAALTRNGGSKRKHAVRSK